MAEIIELKAKRCERLDAEQLDVLHRSDLAIAALIDAWCKLKNNQDPTADAVFAHYLMCARDFIKAHDEMENLPGYKFRAE